MKLRPWILILAAVPGFADFETVRADVKLPAIFGDHMVLQQELKLPVWGTADPGEKVTVTIGPSSATATADAAGKWRVNLPPLPNGTTPETMTVTGRNELVFHDVLVGDVWVCSGQSNMAFHVTKEQAREADDSGLRFFVVPDKTAMHPADEVQGKWEVCTPETAADFSQVAYFFAKELRGMTHHPIGLIGSYWVGSGAHSWVGIDGFRQEPKLAFYAKAYDEAATAYEKNESLAPAMQTAYEAALTQWQRQYGDVYAKAHQAWYDDVKKAQDKGQSAPPRPATLPPDPPRPPLTADGGPHTPSTMFNAMIAPLIPYGIKGAIWYQGESNHARPIEYRTLLTTLINNWRKEWGEGDFPFLIVQLPNFSASNEDWTYLRESELKVSQSVPQTGLAVAIDQGDPVNLHPPHKEFIGQRLARAAMHVAYGTDAHFSGPVFASEKIEGGTVRVTFSQPGGGLVIGTAPYYPQGVKPLPTTVLSGFQITGEDGRWIPAEAKIEGVDVVAVSSPTVPKPVAVRYAWENNPRCNLYSSEGLAVSPFRTDDDPPAWNTEDFKDWRITTPVPAYAKDVEKAAITSGAK